MDIAQYNDVDLTIFHYRITCKGIVKPDEVSEMLAGPEPGEVTSHADRATLETSGGTCRNTVTGEERIFPAGVYRLSKEQGIEKIGEMVDEE